MLGPSVTVTGLPLGLIYSGRAVRRAPDRPFAIAGVVLAGFALIGLGLVILINIFRR